MTSKQHSYLSRPLHLLVAASALVGGLTLVGCSGGAIGGKIDLIDMRSEELLASNLESVNGVYGEFCTNREGPWSLEILPAAALDNPELSVLLNNDACVLTLTELRVTGELAATPASADIDLTASYKVQPSEFGVPVEFYANAKLDAISFAEEFTLTVIYSDDASLLSDDNEASFEEIASSADGSMIASPNYMINPATLSIITDVDQIVVSATGTVGLTAGAQVAQTYVVLNVADLDTYAEIDAAYKAVMTPTAVGASIPAADFDLVGDDLSANQVRTLIFANTVSGVAAYQRFELTFEPAPVIP